MSQFAVKSSPHHSRLLLLLCTRLSAVSCLFTCLLVSDNWMSGARRAEAIIIGDCATLATILAALCSWPSWHHSRDTWQHRPVVTMGVQAEAPPSQRERRSSPQVQGHQQCWIQGHQQCWVSLLYVVSRTGRFVIISQSHDTFWQMSSLSTFFSVVWFAIFWKPQN